MSDVISVVIPTVKEREEHLERCIDAYSTRSIHEVELVVIRDRPHVGRAWNDGFKKTSGDYLHFTADDLEPLMFWDELAVKTAWSTRIPCATRITRPDGTVDRALPHGQVVAGLGGDISVVPFCSRRQYEQIGPFLDCHFFTDSFFSYRCRRLHYQMVGCSQFEFIHHYAQPRRGAGMTEEERMVHDEKIYNAALVADRQP